MRDEGSTRLYEHDDLLSDMDIGTANSIRESGSLYKNPAQRYERRPRHKTKADKYEIKQDGNKSTKKREKKEKKTSASKRDKRPKRKERSGDALVHTFSAPNVAQDRLTVSTV